MLREEDVSAGTTAADATPDATADTPDNADKATAGAGSTATADPEHLTHLTGGWRTLAIVATAAVLVAGTVLRFTTRSPLWLDEALTVNIAGLPLKDLHQALRQDGAPPLYYVLLHFWMKPFGTSDAAVRSLAGVLSVATLPVAWVAARNFGGRTMAWVTTLLLASAPFAVTYATAARMYALVMFLTACGIVALQRALRQPRPGNLIAIGAVTAGLLYSHYWSIYLVAVVALWLLWRARPTDPGHRAARFALGATAVGALTFVPWLPTFAFQSAHTGTPWSKPPNVAAALQTITSFTENQSASMNLATNQARLLVLCYFAVGFLAVFGQARDRWHVVLDLRTRPQARVLLFVVVVTLGLAVGGALVTSSGYSDRYAAVVFVPFLMLLALGTLTLVDARVRSVLVAVAVAAGLVGAAQNVTAERTQAAVVASTLARHAQPGDLVVFCPDQLGPSVWRLVPHDRYRMETYPRGTSPEFVNWVDYDQTIDRTSTDAFTNGVLEQARKDGVHKIWLVWFQGYEGLGERCQAIENQLTAAAGGVNQPWVDPSQMTYYEPIQLTGFTVGR